MLGDLQPIFYILRKDCQDDALLSLTPPFPILCRIRAHEYEENQPWLQSRHCANSPPTAVLVQHSLVIFFSKCGLPHFVLKPLFQTGFQTSRFWHITAPVMCSHRHSQLILQQSRLVFIFVNAPLHLFIPRPGYIKDITLAECVTATPSLVYWARMSDSTNQPGLYFWWRQERQLA